MTDSGKRTDLEANAPLPVVDDGCDFDVERMVIKCFEVSLRNMVPLTEDQAYVAAVSTYVDGQHDLVVQIVPGDVGPDFSPDGGQEGGGLQRRMAVVLSCWFRVKFDQHGYTAFALMETANGILDFMQQLRRLYRYTNFGGLCLEPIWYDGETATTIYNADQGILRREMNFAAAFRETMPRQETITRDDLAEVFEQ